MATVGRTAGEPWYKEDDLREVDDVPMVQKLPLRLAIAADLKTVHLDDCVDYISRTTMTRDEVLQLARELQALAALMHE